jgi:cytochrome bd-type quinol oxidase subunit 2
VCCLTAFFRFDSFLINKIVIQPIIIIIIVVIYVSALLWTNKLINSKIQNKTDRKIYKKDFNSKLGAFFSPLFLVIAVLSIFFSDSIPTKPLLLLTFILKICIVIMSFFYSYLIFPSLKKRIIKLQQDSEEKIMEDVEK